MSSPFRNIAIVGVRPFTLVLRPQEILKGIGWCPIFESIQSIVSNQTVCPDYRLICVQVTASLGSYILAALQCTQEFNITVISRESSNSAFPASQKVIKVPDTYPEDDLVRAFRGQDVVILNIAVGIQDPSKQLIDAAIKAGVKCIIPSDYGSCIATEKTIALFPLAANGAKVIEYLTSADLKGMTWTAVKCGMLFD